MSLDHACGNGRATFAERGDDLYETPEVATQAFVRELERLGLDWMLQGVVWEPACGPGRIARVLRQHGCRVVATDLVDYGSPDQDAGGRDFLFEESAPPETAAIVTNPPFKLAERFVEHALDMRVPVVMLLRLAFMESERRTRILEGRGLREVMVFRRRLPMMHRAGWEGRRANSGMAFAWFVWDPAWRALPQLRRISWDGQGR